MYDQRTPSVSSNDTLMRIPHSILLSDVRPAPTAAQVRSSSLVSWSYDRYLYNPIVPVSCAGSQERMMVLINDGRASVALVDNLPDVLPSPGRTTTYPCCS